MEKRLIIRVYGRVQGVFFRDSAKLKAEELGLRGFVRNERDGTVYGEAEGTQESLEAFVAWCREGPPLAEVERVEASLQEANGSDQGFAVK